MQPYFYTEEQAEKIIELAIALECGDITVDYKKYTSYKDFILSTVKDKYKREYTKQYSEVDDWFADIITIGEWFNNKETIYNEYRGTGYWMKDGFISNDNTHITPPHDATHVIWYNK